MSDIAINPVTRRVQFVGNTGTGPYAFNFNILQASDIVVYKNNVLLVETTDYTVSIAANGTGNITLVVALVTTDILTMLGGRELSRTTDFVTAGDLLASSLNEQLDSNVIMSQQLDERFDRTIKAQPGDADAALNLPVVADRANRILSFDQDGNLLASTASGFFVGANFFNQTYTGDGSTTSFALTIDPGTKNNIQVYIDGVYQNKATFSITASAITFTEAPPLNAAMEFIIGNAVDNVSSDANLVNYNQGGTGAQTRTVENKLQESVSVKDFGAVGDGVADDTAAIQAAIDASDYVVFPKGTYEFNGITIDGPITETGAGKTIDASEAYLQDNAANSTSMFILSSVTATNFLVFKAKSITISAGGGHVFNINGSVNHCQFDIDCVKQFATNRSIINCLDFGFFFNRVKGLYWSIPLTSTVPAINFTSTSNKVSANTFDILRPNQSGSEPFMSLLSTSVSDFNYHNRIRLSNPERCHGGVLRLSRAMNTVVDGMHCFDTGTTVNHMIEVGLAGYLCQNTKIKDYQRNSGTLGAGKVDIMVTDANFTRIDSVSGVGSTTVQVDFTGEPNGLVVGMFKTDVLNKTSGNTVIIDSDTGVYAPTLTIPMSGTILTISTGVITVTDSLHRVDTEGFAATDDLATINGGVDGQVLMLRSASNARDVTLKDGTGNLLLAGDFVLDRDQDLITLHYSSLLSSWVEISRSNNAA